MGASIEAWDWGADEAIEEASAVEYRRAHWTDRVRTKTPRLTGRRVPCTLNKLRTIILQLDDTPDAGGVGSFDVILLELDYNGKVLPRTTTLEARQLRLPLYNPAAMSTLLRTLRNLRRIGFKVSTDPSSPRISRHQLTFYRRNMATRCKYVGSHALPGRTCR